MSFASITFFIFFMLILVISYLIKNRKIRHILLLLSSYVFYGWWDWRFCFLMFGLTAIAYISAIGIGKSYKKRLFLVVGIVIPLIILAIFKYFNFFVSSFVALFNIHNISALNIILPVGISFYTFQSLSYTIDVYKNKISPIKEFYKLALYIAFFPQLVAGPIVRASDFLPQLEEERNVNKNNLRIGIQIFIFGLFKKVVVSDWLSVFVDDVFRTPKAFHAISIILAVIAYAIQIYFDFSGYSDMAIGCAKCMGYDFNRNFNMPYFSKNIQEFWKRWHISLSTWLKDYLYIPLGGNRKGAIRTYLNNFITMLLGGLWHGANWTFVVWGGLHGLALITHKFYKERFIKQGSSSQYQILKKTGVGLSILLNNIFVCFCWVFFRSDSFETAWEILQGIFTWQNGIIQIYSWGIIAILLIMAAYSIAIIKSHKNTNYNGKINGFYPILGMNKFSDFLLLFIVIGIIAGLAYTGANPFIYFQF